MIQLHLAPWLKDLLRDPLSKGPLKEEELSLVSTYGRRYPIVNGVCDLRLLTWNAEGSQAAWAEGQVAYEKLSDRIATTDNEDYEGQKANLRDVYATIPVIGRCLDVGGNDGRLRVFLKPGQEYVSYDPFLEVVHERRSERYWKAYPFEQQPLSFICGLAEHLPFPDSSFDTVHMRSVIDHFLNPELALREAYRALRPEGQLVIGSYVLGGRSGKTDAVTQAKEAVRSTLVTVGFHRFADHHLWHPTYEALLKLVAACGFQHQLTHWQKSEGDRVCYLRATK